jgi:hypothetical protein
MGRAAVPGTGYLEMVHKVFSPRTDGTIELRDVQFVSPLYVGEQEEKEIEVVLEGTGDEATFRVRSASPAPGNGGPSWQQHATGRVAGVAAKSRRHRLDELSRACEGVELTGDELMKGRDSDLVAWGPRWQNLKRASFGKDQGLAELELPDEFVPDLETFALHPALLDVATSFAAGLSPDRDGQGYLPSTYRRIRVWGPLGKRVFCHSQLRNGKPSEDGMITLDVTIMDEDGNELMDIDGFKLERIPITNAKTGTRPRPPRRGLPGADLLEFAISPDEGAEALERILSHAVLPQMVVSTRHLPALLERMADGSRSSELAEAPAAGRKELHPRPDVATAYARPRNSIEETLVQIWQSAIGIEQVGIHDNFFDLGGDSVLGLQVTNQAKKAGLRFTPAMLFEQTIAELAANLGETATIEAERENAAPLIDLGEVELGRIGEPERIADLYPLTSLQRSVLFHCLEASAESTYILQYLFRFHAEFDLRAFESAWKYLLDRYPTLRSTFVVEGLKEPLQVVWRHARPEVRFQDWRALPERERQERLETFLAEDVRRGFQLSQAPLVRLGLFRWGSRETQVVLSHHHLIMDGWSLQHLFRELVLTLETIRQGKEPELPPPSSYRDFIAWRQRQDHSPAEAYWRQTLKGFTRTKAIADRGTAAPDKGGDRHRTVSTRLPISASEKLISWVREHRMTLTTVVLAAWARLLGRESGARDIVLGMAVSGRSADLDGVMTMVGMLINILPVRVRLEAPPSAVLEEIQRQQLASARHEHVPLDEVQAWSDLPRDQPLIESVVRVQNFTREESSSWRDVDGKHRCQDIHWHELWHYPTSLEVVLESELTFRISYDRRRIADADAERLVNHLPGLIEGVMAGEDAGECWT